MWSYVRRPLNPAIPQVTATTVDLAAPLPLVMEGKTPPAIAVQSPGVFADRPSDSSTKTVTSNRTALDLSTDSDDNSSDPVATIAAAAELTPVSLVQAKLRSCCLLFSTIESDENPPAAAIPGLDLEPQSVAKPDESNRSTVDNDTLFAAPTQVRDIAATRPLVNCADAMYDDAEEEVPLSLQEAIELGVGIDMEVARPCTDDIKELLKFPMILGFDPKDYALMFIHIWIVASGERSIRVRRATPWMLRGAYMIYLEITSQDWGKMSPELAHCDST
ncbi:uncharacterized protein RSE6_11838 [Rhynchosporium secalis]|uniref:Uncharacterized protein n=1 Tax=Rhynchosporium secalis TaxID=38038 RepID=A0A1E1MNW5_RHYSE|nr:uncharacterized protein RSE6_11838 [Rhynchosporium secalis]